VRKTNKIKFLAVDGDFGKGPCDLSDLVYHKFVCRLSFGEIELSRFAQECWGLGDLPRIQHVCKLIVSIGMYFEVICYESGFRMRVSVPWEVQHHAANSTVYSRDVACPAEPDTYKQDDTDRLAGQCDTSLADIMTPID